MKYVWPRTLFTNVIPLFTIMSTHPGEIILSGLTSLDSRRPVPGKPYSFIYDATFTCADTTTDGVGSYRCYVGQDLSKKQDDLYDVTAKVQCFLSVTVNFR